MSPVLGYRPEAITANVGDVVEFQFMQKNHTATQSTFAEPCIAMQGGKDSGFMPNPEGKPGVTWNMTVETTDATCKSAAPVSFPSCTSRQTRRVNVGGNAVH